MIKNILRSDNEPFHWFTREATYYLSSFVRRHPDSGMLPWDALCAKGMLVLGTVWEAPYAVTKTIGRGFAVYP
jgi:hypothetical protein